MTKINGYDFDFEAAYVHTEKARLESVSMCVDWKSYYKRKSEDFLDGMYHWYFLNGEEVFVDKDQYILLSYMRLLNTEAARILYE